MTYTGFALLLGMYDTDFTTTSQYEQLLIDFPPGITPKGLWQHLSRGRNYKPGLTKASFLSRLALMHIHVVKARSFAGQADSTGVVGWHELLFCYSLTERRPVHLGYIRANFIAH